MDDFGISLMDSPMALVHPPTPPPPHDGDAPPTPPSPQSKLQNPDPASQHPDPPSPDKDLSHVGKPAASPSLPVEYAQGDLGSKFCNPQHHQASNSPNPASLWIDEVPQQPEPAQRPSILADLVHDLESLLKGEKSDSLKTPSAQQSQDGWASSPAEGKEPPQASSKINGATTTPNAQPPPLASGGSSVLQHKGSRTEQPVRGEGESPHKPAPTSMSSSRSDLGQDSEALKMDQNISTMKSTKAQQATPRQMAASTVGKSPTRHHSKSNGATAPPPVHDPQTASTQTHSRQKQQDHPRLSQKEKAKGVLEIVDSTPSSPTFTSKLPKSMQYRRDSGTRFEMGESSTQALIFAGKGKWTEVKSPYWWRKERQQSRTSAEANQRTDPNRGKNLFRQHAYGKCFNCFAASHQVRDCRAPTRCWRCNGDGHRAARCCRPAVRPLNPPPCPPPRSSSSTSSPSHPRTLGDNHRSYLEVARGEQPMAAYPGDPRARPAGGSVCISATGAIKRRRDALVRKAVVCSLEGNNYDSEIYHVRDAIRSQFKLGFGDFQVIKHYPEQYLVIFSDPQNWERATRQRSIVDNGRVYKFAPWDETREAVHAHLEFRVHARIEGIPPHAWGADVAEKILGKSCAIHYVEEHTRRRERTRTYDLWAWCSDPCKIPTEVWLTITDPDMEPPPVDIPLSHTTVHQDPPTDIKHGLVFRVLPHVATIEDLSFIRGNGGPGGPPNRKRHRHFDWRYGEPDSRGEVRGRQDHGHGRDGPRQHRWDDEEDGRRGHLRRHTSASAWGRVTRCRNGAADCYSSNFRGSGGSRRAGDSYRSRDYKPEEKSFFYKAKVAPLPTSNSKSTRQKGGQDWSCSPRNGSRTEGTQHYGLWRCPRWRR